MRRQSSRQVLAWISVGVLATAGCGSNGKGGAYGLLDAAGSFEPVDGVVGLGASDGAGPDASLADGGGPGDDVWDGGGPGDDVWDGGGSGGDVSVGGADAVGADSSPPEDVGADTEQPCVPASCQGAGVACGPAPDGCGGTLACGDCEGTAMCQGGACVAEGCEDPCGPLWSESCAGSTGTKVCAPDPSGVCPDLGPFVSCGWGATCTGGACQGGCPVPELMVVLDRSSSMKGALWTFTHDALAAWLQEVAPLAQIGLRTFPSDADGCAPGPTTPLDFDQAGALIDAMTPPSSDASTPLGTALDGLQASFGDPIQGEAVILLTDGSETCGDAGAALGPVAALRARGTRVYVIGLGFGYDEQLLADIASLGGSGELRVAKDGPALQAALRAIFADVTGCQGPAGPGAAGCQDGACVTLCAAGHHLCGGTCVADDDTSACGPGCVACPTVANGDVACTGGACTLTCTGATHECAGACVADASVDHCGSLCSPCPDPANGSPTCVAGACGIACDGGRHPCSGACLSDTSPQSCGAACSPCPGTAHGSATCNGGACGLQCSGGYHLCGGACVADDSLTACGASCAVCPTSPSGKASCTAGTCVLTCNPGTHLCGSKCQPDSSITACGAACVTCPTVSGASTTCTGGACVVQCSAGLLYCGGQCLSAGAITVEEHTFGGPDTSEGALTAVALADGGTLVAGFQSTEGTWWSDAPSIRVTRASASGADSWSVTVPPTAAGLNAYAIAAGTHPDGGYLVVGPAWLVTTPKGLQRVRLSAQGAVLSSTTATEGIFNVYDAAVLPDGGFAVLSAGKPKMLKVVRFDAQGALSWSKDVDMGFDTGGGKIAAFPDGSIGVASASGGAFGYVHLTSQGTPGPVVSSAASSVYGLAPHPDGGAIVVGGDGTGHGLATRIGAAGTVAWSKSATWKGRFVSAADRADGSIALGGIDDNGASGWDTLVLRVADPGGEKIWERSWFNKGSLQLYVVGAGAVVVQPGGAFSIVGQADQAYAVDLRNALRFTVACGL